MNRNRVRVPLPVLPLAVCLLVVAALDLAVARAEEPPVLSGTVRGDGSTPPVGRYVDTTAAQWVSEPHPTTYIVGGRPSLGVIDADWEHPLGNAMPKDGISSFYGTTDNSPDPARYRVFSRLPGERRVGGSPTIAYILAPYFDAYEEITCDEGVCDGSLVKRLFARLGSVDGSVVLTDGTPVCLWKPNAPAGSPCLELTVRALPCDPDDPDDRNGGCEPLPPGAEARGFHAYSTTTVGPSQLFSFRRHELRPTGAQCGSATCVAIPIDPGNEWGLPVLGDGGELALSRFDYSDQKGVFRWRIEAVGKKKYATVESSKSTRVDFAITFEDLSKELQKPEYQSENRPDKELIDLLKCGPTEVAPHPVSVITGNVLLDEVDEVLPGLEDLVFTRSYNSFSGPAGSLGQGWSHSFERRVETVGPRILRMWEGHGAPRHYTERAGGSYVRFGAVAAPMATIARTEVGFRRTFRRGGIEEFDTAGRLARVEDRLGRSTALQYDAQNRLSSITSPEGRRFRLRYGSWSPSRLIALEGPEGVIASYSYGHTGSANGPVQLKSVRYADGTGYTYVYDSLGRMTTRRTLAGVTLDRHGYDDQGRAAWSELDAGQEHYTYTYDDGSTTVRDGRGKFSVFRWERKATGRYVTGISGCGFCGSATGERTWTRDDDGRITKYVDADGVELNYDYDGDGNLTEVRDALSVATAYARHDSFGRPREITRRGFGTTTITYLPQGVETVRLPGGQTTTYGYTDGRLTSATTGEGTRFGLRYNALGELEAITDPRDKDWTYTYDRSGRRATVTTPEGVTTRVIRAARGRIAAVQRPDGKSVRFDYDRSGRLESTTDAAGRQVRFAYGPFGRTGSAVGPIGDLTRLGYDTLSNLTSLTDAEGRTTTFVPDEVDRVERVIDPLEGVERYTYKPSGRVETRTDRKGVVTTYDYDDLGRLRSMTFSDGTPAVTIVYDDTNRTVTHANGTDTVTLVLDPSSRVVSETSARNGSTVTYTYNDDHQRETVSLNGALVAVYGYENGYLTSITSGGETFGFEYDDAGRRRTLTCPNGVVTTYRYHETRGWLESIRAVHGGRTVLDVAYTYDAVGNTVSKNTPEWTEVYRYDPLSRLVGVTRGETSWSYSYDLVGNRISHRTDGRPRSYAYDDRNRLMGSTGTGLARVEGTTTEPAAIAVNARPAAVGPGDVFGVDVPIEGADPRLTVTAVDVSGNLRTNTYGLTADLDTTYAWDANGNMVEKREGTTKWTYEWNAFNQLTRVLRDQVEVARFAYDPLGRRVERVGGGVTYRWTYDHHEILLEGVADAATTRNRLYVHGPGLDEPLAYTDLPAGATTFYHVDGLGSIVKTTDGSGVVAEVYRYDAWGAIETETGPSGYAFTGREWDAETGWYYYRARYYDPKVGRFVSEDPIGLGGGINYYQYVENNPATLRDPTGLQTAQPTPQPEPLPGPTPAPETPTPIPVTPADASRETADPTIQADWDCRPDLWTTRIASCWASGGAVWPSVRYLPENKVVTYVGGLPLRYVVPTVGKGQRPVEDVRTPTGMPNHPRNARFEPGGRARESALCSAVVEMLRGAADCSHKILACERRP